MWYLLIEDDNGAEPLSERHSGTGSGQYQRAPIKLIKTLFGSFQFGRVALIIMKIADILTANEIINGSHSTIIAIH